MIAMLPEPLEGELRANGDPVLILGFARFPVAVNYQDDPVYQSMILVIDRDGDFVWTEMYEVRTYVEVTEPDALPPE